MGSHYNRIYAKQYYSKTKAKYLMGYLFLVTAFILYGYGEIFKSYHMLQIALLCVVIFLVLRFGDREHAAIFAFIICFSTFLLNKIFLTLVDSNIHLDLQYNDEVMMHLHRSLFMALIFVWIGAVIQPGKKLKMANSKTITGDSKTRYIQRAAEILFYLTSVVKAMELLEKIVYVVFVGGYLNYYIDFASNIPGIIRKIGDLNEITFFIFLGTMPDPRKKKAPFIIFILFAFMILLYGQRNGIVTGAILILVYCIVFENLNNVRYQIIPKSAYKMGIILFPIIIIALDGVNFIRSGLEYDSGGIISTIERFMANIGNSIRVIIYGYDFKDLIIQDRLYSFGTLTSFWKNNIITQLFSGSSITVFNSTVAQAEDMALNGYAYGYAVSYLYSKSAYLAGHGLGSSYIAEAFHDFGYIGICIFSTIYGNILSKVPKLLGNGWIMNSIILISFYNLLLTPRDTACKFLAAFINYQFVFTVLLVYFFGIALKQRGDVKLNPHKIERTWIKSRSK